MTKKNKALYLKRLKSFAWRTGMMVLATLVAFLLENLSLLDLNPQVTVVMGLILGEVSKYLNTQK